MGEGVEEEGGPLPEPMQICMANRRSKYYIKRIQLPKFSLLNFHSCEKNLRLPEATGKEEKDKDKDKDKEHPEDKDKDKEDPEDKDKDKEDPAKTRQRRQRQRQRQRRK